MHLYPYEQKVITQHPLMCSEHPQGLYSFRYQQLYTLRGAHPECKQHKVRNRQNASQWDRIRAAARSSRKAETVAAASAAVS